MFTSGTDARMKKTALVCTAFSVVLVLFNLLYTYFGYGETSPFLQYMFLIPLVGGTLVAAVIHIARQDMCVSRLAFNLWNSGLACLTTGCLVRGIVNVSGRFTDYDGMFYIAGGIFLLIAIGVTIVNSFNKIS